MYRSDKWWRFDDERITECKENPPGLVQNRYGPSWVISNSCSYGVKKHTFHVLISICIANHPIARCTQIKNAKQRTCLFTLATVNLFFDLNLL